MRVESQLFAKNDPHARVSQNVRRYRTPRAALTTPASAKGPHVRAVNDPLTSFMLNLATNQAELLKAGRRRSPGAVPADAAYLCASPGHLARPASREPRRARAENCDISPSRQIWPLWGSPASSPTLALPQDLVDVDVSSSCSPAGSPAGAAASRRATFTAARPRGSRRRRGSRRGTRRPCGSRRRGTRSAALLQPPVSARASAPVA